MALDFGGLIHGLTTAAGGVAQGLNERKKREQQALHQRLAEELLRAQIANYQSEAAARLRPHPTKIDPNSPEGIAAAIAKKQGGAKGKKDPLTDSEKRAAKQVVRGLREMRDHYRADPHAAETSVGTAALEGIGHLPFIGGLAAGVTGPAAQKSRSAHQQGFQRAATTVRHHYGMISPHARISLGLLHDINTAIVPPAGTDSSTIANSFAPEWDYTIDQVNSQLGPDAEPETPQTPRAPTPKTPATPATGYNKKFWHP